MTTTTPTPSYTCSLSMLTDWANHLVGQPYRFGGRGTAERPGYDCLGVIVATYQFFGLPIFDDLPPEILGGLYHTDNQKKQTLSYIKAARLTEQFQFVSYPHEPVRALDIVGLIFDHAAHAGLILPRGQFLHATQKHGCVTVATSAHRYLERACYIVRYRYLQWTT